MIFDFGFFDCGSQISDCGLKDAERMGHGAERQEA
jgi:hypothetical protein